MAKTTDRIRAGLDWLHLGGRRPPLWLELLFVVWLCWLYDLVANLAPVRAGEAHRDAGWILQAEKVLHIDPEAALEHWLAGQHTLALVVSDYYDNAHFVVTLGLVGALWWMWPALYRPLRNAMVIMNVVAMAVFWVFPAAPPRLFDPSIYPDVVASTHAFGSWHSGALAGVADQFAAMPSLHIGWACWSALALWRILRRRWWAASVWLYPLATAGAVMATGNHFLLDIVGGLVVFVASVVGADRWQEWWEGRRARRALALADIEGAALGAHPYEASTHHLPDSR